MFSVKRRVVIHVTFIKIGEINTLKETFDADVLIRAKWREPRLDKSNTQELDQDSTDWSQYWNPKLFIENAVGEPKSNSSHQVEYGSNGEATMLERVRFKGTFLEQMELWEFPFDLQDLTVNVMSDMPSTEVEFVEDPDEIHRIFKQSFIDEQEFYLYKYIDSESKELQKDRADPFVRRSVLTVRCRAARRPWCFIWNHFAVTNRLQLAFTLMLTNVAFKFVITQSLPRISYLTYLRKVKEQALRRHSTHTGKKADAKGIP
ncbi:hypothetical protein LSH36_430g00057 [Paralvinella palmiformis]|uniref:Neurotransmitter-gated ion-channel ligand-binding domain-containing protein n=1 Tax=Paralvinella palmiformis TaxID=53620 RepID=A0AAD9JBA9_9ANNE|nr:hypothetical protein LSH36_430g00057 [Paralvinella palmiformis]